MSTTPIQSASKKVRPPVVSTVIILAIGFIGAFIYAQIAGPFEGHMAVQQADGTASGAIVGTFFSRHDLSSMLRWGSVGIVVLIWGLYALRMRAESSSTTQSVQS